MFETLFETTFTLKQGKNYTLGLSRAPKAQCSCWLPARKGVIRFLFEGKSGFKQGAQKSAALGFDPATPGS